MNTTPPILDESLRCTSGKNCTEDGRISYRHLTVFTVAVVAVVCVIANLFLPWVFWDSVSEWIFLAMFAVGGLAAQVAVLSVWAGMGAQPLRLRLLHTSLLIGAVCVSYILGLQLPDLPNPGLPRVVAYIIFGIGVGGFCIGATSFFLIAVATKTRIGHRSEVEQQAHHNGISIAYVIGITTVVAILVAIVPKIMPNREESLSRGEFTAVSLMCLQHVVFSLASLLLSTWAMLSTKRNLGYWLVLIGMVPILTFANLLLLGSYRRVTVDADLIAAVSGFTLGFVVLMNALLGVFRWLGYRILPSR